MKKDHSNEVAASIDRFEGNKAVLILDGEEIIIPKKYLKDAKEGDQIVVILTNDEELRKQKEERAKKLLNEILKEGK